MKGLLIPYTRGGVILNLAAIGGVLGFWLVVVGFVILALGNLLKGL